MHTKLYGFTNLVQARPTGYYFIYDKRISNSIVNAENGFQFWCESAEQRPEHGRDRTGEQMIVTDLISQCRKNLFNFDVSSNRNSQRAKNL